MSGSQGDVVLRLNGDDVVATEVGASGAYIRADASLAVTTVP